MLLVILNFISVKSFSQEVHSLEIVDYAIPSSHNRVITMPVKTIKPQMRTSKENFKLYYTGNFSENMKNAIEEAVNLWQEQLVIDSSVILPLVFHLKKLESEVATKTTVGYLNYNGISYSELTSINKGFIMKSDSVGLITMIEVNDSIDFWGYYNHETGMTDPDRVDMSTAVARAIAQALGFGTSLYTRERPRFGYVLGHPSVYSIFDQNIMDSSGKLLSSIPVSASTLIYDSYAINNKAFVLGHELFIATDRFDNNYTLRTFASEGELLSKNLRKGNRILNIDQKLADCMQIAGWHVVHPSSISIEHPDSGIQSTGIVSVYKPQIFSSSIQPADAVVSAYKWELWLPDTTGNSIVVQSGENNSFIIQPLQDISNFGVNANGYIEGELVLSAVVNGIPKRVKKALYLEIKPSPIVIRNVTITKGQSNGFFNVEYEAEYWGGDDLKMVIEQDNISSLLRHVIRIPNYSTFTYTNLRTNRYVWFHFTSTNRFGTETLTHEIEPVYLPKLSMNSDLSTGPTINTDICYYQIFDLQGNKIGHYASNNFENIPLNAGIYIVNAFNQAGECIWTRKIHKRD